SRIESCKGRESHEVVDSSLVANAKDHGIVTIGFDLKIAGDAQFPCILLLASPYRRRGGCESFKTD
ncbi:MAG: hypothetical protein WAO83_00880, partial [Fuerstiella sp.]